MKAIWKDQVIADSSDPLEIEGSLYFPQDSVNYDYLVSNEGVSSVASENPVLTFNLEVNGEQKPNAAWYYPNQKNTGQVISGYVAFWNGVQIVD
jgi:uncharacterized protein (DUF427 family)